MTARSDRFLITIDGVSHPLRVLSFMGTEGISELYQVDLLFACQEGTLEAEDVLGRAALLSFLSGEDTARHVHGIVSRFEEGEAGKKTTMYRLLLVPRVWRLQHRQDCRIFQDLRADEIVTRVLEGAGLTADKDFRFALQGTYKKRDYCVQYRESDWAFVCRLLEDEGIFWFFDHAEDEHVLVFGDQPSAHAPIPGAETVVFRPPVGAMSHGEHVHRLQASNEIRPGKVTLRDYNYHKPGLSLQAEAQSTIDSDLEVYDYPGAYESPQQGAAIAKVRLEERQVLRRVAEGESACQRFTAGAMFTLADHPREAWNRRYLITRVDYEGFEPGYGAEGGAATAAAGSEGDGEDRFKARFQCIAADQPFRPPILTARPHVRGVQSAVVVGPSGEEIHTDDLGRVKVQFHWDRLGKRDDHSSCWIRVSQVWAGEGWGAMHVPRIGQEVLIDFLDGDPDRPIVVGRVYHGTNAPPYALPGEKTKSTVKSQSSPGGGGSNELRFEDKKGAEEIHLHAQKDLDIVVENDAAALVGRDDKQHVKRNRAVLVDKDHAEDVGENRTRSVGGDENVSVTKNRSLSVGADAEEDVGGQKVVSIGKARTVEVGTDASENIGGKLFLGVGGRADLDVGTDMGVKVGGSSAEEVELEKAITVGSKIVITCGDAKVTIEKSGKITVTGKELSFAVDGPAKLDAKDVEVASSGKVKVEASGKVEIKGSGPMDIQASGQVKVKGSNVGIN